MPQPIHPTDGGDRDALRRHLIAEHGVAADDVPRTRAALDGVHDRIHHGFAIPGATATHCSDRTTDNTPAAAAAGRVDSQTRRCATRVTALSHQDPQLAAALVDHHCRDLRAVLASASPTERADARDPARGPAMTGRRLRDTLVALVNADDTHGLAAHPVGMLLSRGRHALDIADPHGLVWRVDVHDHPRTLPEVAS